MPVAEIRRAGDRHALVRCELHPQQRAADEQVRRHQVLAHTRVHHDQVQADQAHVVRQRHPARARCRCSLKPAPGVAPSAFARMFACVSTTPLGSLVEPEENWMNAVSSGRRRAPAARASRCRRARRSGTCAARAPTTRSTRRSPRQRRRGGRGASGRCRGAARPSFLAMRSSLCLCSSLMPSATGTGHDAAEHAGPEGVEELLVVRDVQDQPVAGLRAALCRWSRMPSARRRSSDSLQRFLGAFAFEINDRAVAAAAMLEHLGKRLVSDHRSWQRFARRVWAGGVAASSGELPLDEPSDRTTCSVARSWHARMGARAAAATAVRSPARARIPRPGVASREPRRDGSAVRGGGTSRLWRRRAGKLRFPEDAKPRVAGGPFFSISHTAQHVACAASRECDIGLDHEDYAGEEAPARLRHWTAVEATLKAAGAGLRRTGAVEVDVELRLSRLDDAEYHLVPLDLGPGIVACLAASSRPDTIEIQRLAGVAP